MRYSMVTVFEIRSERSQIQKIFIRMKTLKILLLFILFTQLQWCALENQQSPFYVVNEVTLKGQNPSLKFCQPLELSTQLKKALDLLILIIWSL